MLAANAEAQGRAAIPAVAPAETPPNSFTGRQYVDSRGCAFIRTGFGGQVVWAPRLTLDREPVCGLTPSLGGARAARVAPPAPTPADPPMTGRMTGCPADRPFGQRVAATDGRRGLLCASAPAPLVSGPVAVAQAGQAPAPARTAAATATPPRPASAPAAAATLAARPPTPTMPAGYKPVWSDDRLNPRRGGRSEAGRAAMNAVWTQTVPRRLIDPHDKGLAPIAGAPRVSTRSAPNRAGPPALVQVGMFREAENARAAVARLAALGLPVRLGRTASGAQVVSAGPFAEPAAARAALAASRNAGFGDAFLRR